MNEVLLELTEPEFSEISQMPCAVAALEICKIHFRRIDKDVSFATPGKGVDLRVRFHDGVELDLEVKGTESAGIAWTQFKVSSQQSHDLLTQGMPVYRVTEIGSRTIKIFIMKYGVDFKMKPEPRWAVHRP
jgi:hypothetical protein